MNWHSSSVADVLDALQTSTKGLRTDIVEKRQVQYGLNSLDTHRGLSAFSLLLKQFKNFIIYILLFAAGISFILGEMIEVVAITIILILNATIGFLQEWQAERRIKALSEMVPQTVHVYRDGTLVNRSVTELVPGDIFVLETGNIVPADARVIEAHHARVVESSLTGESEPQSKRADILEKEDIALSERENMVYASTILSTGRIVAVVVSTGMHTEIGRIADLLQEATQTSTPLQKQLDVLGKTIGKYVLLLCFLLFLYGAIRDQAFTVLMEEGILAFFIETRIWIAIALSLAVSAVPEGLPTVVTISLSMGVKRMAKRQALIRRLSSVESLGQTTVICTDKTGTLTQNKMIVQTVATVDALYQVGERYNPSKELHVVLRTGALCNDAHIPTQGREFAVGDPTEIALIQSVIDIVGSQKMLIGWSRIDELQFDSDRKCMSTIDAHSTEGTWVHTKGAIERILDISTHMYTVHGIKKMTKKQKEQFLVQAEQFASDGMRVLGCAIRSWGTGEVTIDTVEQKMIFVGMQAMIDPPHAVVPDAIATCARAGIRVIMITGDNPVTAAAIAAQVGIVGDTMTGDEFMALSQESQCEALSRVGVFSRVAPAHKFHIVSLLQEQGEIVAMTGDGVNDAPAIKKADFGIAMGINGTDISKQSSDMILLDDNFATIVAAVEEGRNIYENIRKVVNYLLSSNTAEICIILGSLLLGLPLPLVAIMILWINLVTDGLPALSLSMDPGNAQIMERPPKTSTEGFITKNMLMTMGIAVLLITGMVIAVYAGALSHYAYLGDAALARAQTIAFTTLIALEIVRISIIRYEYGLSMFSNRWLNAAVTTTILLHIIILYTPAQKFLHVVPIGYMDWLFVIGVLCSMLAISRIIPHITQMFHATHQKA
jgi:Ca2+-transporting ATPase